MLQNNCGWIGQLRIVLGKKCTFLVHTDFSFRIYIIYIYIFIIPDPNDLKNVMNTLTTCFQCVSNVCSMRFQWQRMVCLGQVQMPSVSGTLGPVPVRLSSQETLILVSQSHQVKTKSSKSSIFFKYNFEML